MNKQTEKILDGLKIAMEAELTGHQFYKAASKNTKDQKGKRDVLQDGRRRDGTLQLPAAPVQSILKNGEYDFTKKLPKSHKKGGSGLIFSKEIQDRIRPATSK